MQAAICEYYSIHRMVSSLSELILILTVRYFKYVPVDCKDKAQTEGYLLIPEERNFSWYCFTQIKHMLFVILKFIDGCMSEIFSENVYTMFKRHKKINFENWNWLWSISFELGNCFLRSAMRGSSLWITFTGQTVKKIFFISFVVRKNWVFDSVAGKVKPCNSAEVNVFQSVFFSVRGMPFRKMDRLRVEERVTIIKFYYKDDDSAVSTFFFNLFGQYS